MFGLTIGVGDPTRCEGIASGDLCSIRCVCLNFENEPSSLELKRLVADATGRLLSGGRVWTASDEATLRGWAESLHDVWRGPVRGDLLQQTESGWAWPTVRGLHYLLRGCVRGPENFCQDAYPIIGNAMAWRSQGDARTIDIRPPVFGASSATAPPVGPDPTPPQSREPPGDEPYDPQVPDIALQGSAPAFAIAGMVVLFGVVIGAVWATRRPGARDTMGWS